ncbi:MAG: hypothetical protein K8W52_14425 [Deltaproteobacteria bacterium]|nr:hypothetical protein [Deltaproteobacteria bacterium]
MSRIAKTLACILAATAVTATGAPRAHADTPTLEDLGKAATLAFSSSGTSDSSYASGCEKMIAALSEAGTPDSAAVTLERDSGKLKAGPTTFGAVKAHCRSAYAGAILPMMTGPVGAGAMLYELAHFDPKDPAKVASFERYVRTCNELTDEAVKYGLDPNLKVELDSGDGKWSGKLGEVKAQVCDKGTAALKAAVEAQLGPFKAAGIAGDKLDMIASYYPLGFYIPGGSYSVGATDPKALKKANVWFVISEGDYCGVDKIEYVFKRYQFDKNQKIAKTSEKKYCGDPGAKAVR